MRDREGALAVAKEIPLRIKNLSKNLLYLGQVYADPRDALNEFVSNAADEYVQSGRLGGLITIGLKRTGQRPHIRISDDGRGMSRGKLEAVATSLCHSEKAELREIPEIIGEKGIGILGFAALAEQCDIVTRAEGTGEVLCMSLVRGKETCRIFEELERQRASPGTDVYLCGIGKDVWRILTPNKLAEYFRIRRRAPLLRGDYRLEIVERRKTMPVQAETYKGIPFPAREAATPYGPVGFHLYLWPTPAQNRSVALIGKGGTTILDDIADLEEFARPPWTLGQVQGDMTFPALEQTTGRKGVMRDAERFPAFEAAVRAFEAALLVEIRRITREHEERLDRRLYSVLREVFAKVLRELDDLESPARVGVASPEGREVPGGPGGPGDRVPGGSAPRPARAGGGSAGPAVDPGAPGTVRQRERPLPTWDERTFPEEKAHLRSELDEARRLIVINRGHPDYVAHKQPPAAFLYYIAMLTAKEIALWHRPRADGTGIAEEMVRILLRAKKYIPEQVPG